MKILLCNWYPRRIFALMKKNSRLFLMLKKTYVMQRMFNFNVLCIVIRNEHYSNSLTINILGNWLPTFLLFGFLGLVGLLQFLVTFTTILYSCRVLVCPTKRNPIVCNCNSESFARGNVIVLNNTLVTRISVHARLI